MLEGTPPLSLSPSPSSASEILTEPEEEYSSDFVSPQPSLTREDRPRSSGSESPPTEARSDKGCQTELPFADAFGRSCCGSLDAYIRLRLARLQEQLASARQSSICAARQLRPSFRYMTFQDFQATMLKGSRHIDR